MAKTVPWNRAIRYVAADGEIRYGEPRLSNNGDDILDLAQKGELEVNILEGSSILTAIPTTKIDKVQTLLSPLAVSDVPFIRCVGLNYKSHILETGRALPVCPTIFCKPSTTIAGPQETIPIPKVAQEQCDYEGELAIVIGRDAKDVRAEDALDFVAGYTVCNDISARDWQRETDKAGPVPQWSFSKSFDKYAPIGPCLVSTGVLGAAGGLELATYVNGQRRQWSNTSDLYFDVPRLVAFCSQGQTLQAGSIILTGTPGGVGLFMKPNAQFLKNGDEVTVSIKGIGKISNRMSF